MMNIATNFTKAEIDSDLVTTEAQYILAAP